MMYLFAITNHNGRVNVRNLPKETEAYHKISNSESAIVRVAQVHDLRSGATYSSWVVFVNNFNTAMTVMINLYRNLMQGPLGRLDFEISFWEPRYALTLPKAIADLPVALYEKVIHLSTPFAR